MKLHKKFWILTITVLAVGLTAGSMVGERLAHADRQLTSAAWAQVFDSPRGLAQGVDVVALVQPISVSPGRVAVSENGEDSLPFQLVEMEVLRSLEGATDGDRLIVERAGGVDLDHRTVILDADGGDFDIGGIYLVFLKRQPGSSYYYQVNDQGRYALRDDHFFAVDPDDQVAAHFHGASFEEGMDRAAQALSANRAPRRPRVK